MSRRVEATLLVLLVAVAAHVDYHLGRGHELPQSLAWSYHWVFAVVVGAAVAWIATRHWRTALPGTLAIVLGGLVLAQGIEPIVEGLVEFGRFTYPVDGERWRIFFEFVVGSALGIAIGLGIGKLGPRPMVAR